MPKSSEYQSVSRSVHGLMNHLLTSSAMLFVYGGGIPFAIIALWLLVTRSHIQKAHITILGLLICLILTTFITDVLPP